MSNKNANPSIQFLLEEIDQANDKCRGGPDKVACDKRGRLMQEAEKAGWCWGPQDEVGYKQRWIQCSNDPARITKSQWYAHDINHAHCMASPSPADKIREIQEFGKTPRTNDLATGSVEVELDIGNGKSEVWTFYRTIESCDRSLPRSKKIESKYE